MRSLFEDWQLRREQFRAVKPPQSCAGLIRVLDYLIVRYAKHPTAHAVRESPRPYQLEKVIPTIEDLFDRYEFPPDELSLNLAARNILALVTYSDLQSDATDYLREMYR